MLYQLKVIREVATKKRYTGINLVEALRIGNSAKGENVQVRAAPPKTAPTLRAIVGAIRYFSLLVLEELGAEKEGELNTNIVNRAEYKTVNRVANPNIKIINELVFKANADSIIVSFE